MYATPDSKSSKPHDARSALFEPQKRVLAPVGSSSETGYASCGGSVSGMKPVDSSATASNAWSTQRT